jgi:hypothetical protein
MARQLEGSTLYAEGVTLLEGDVEGTVHETSCHDFYMSVHLVNIGLLNREWQTTFSVMAVVIGLGDWGKHGVLLLHYVTPPA